MERFDLNNNLWIWLKIWGKVVGPWVSTFILIQNLFFLLFWFRNWNKDDSPQSKIMGTKNILRYDYHTNNNVSLILFIYTVKNSGFLCFALRPVNPHSLSNFRLSEGIINRVGLEPPAGARDRYYHPIFSSNLSGGSVVAKESTANCY